MNTTRRATHPRHLIRQAHQVAAPIIRAHGFTPTVTHLLGRPVITCLEAPTFTVDVRYNNELRVNGTRYTVLATAVTDGLRAAGYPATMITPIAWEEQ